MKTDHELAGETPRNTTRSVFGSRTGFPFGFSHDAYAFELEYRETQDLLREAEASQWLALKCADDADGTRDYIEYQLSTMLDELERRQKLRRAHPTDPLRPHWPKADDTFRDRIEAVRTAWPIERFCRELLACELIAAGRGKWKARCPLPGHNDRTPSFSIDAEKNVAYCHGCQRGGDVLKLTQYVLNVERFMDALVALEGEGGVR